MCVALLEFPIGLTNFGQRVDVRNRNFQSPCGDQSGEFRKDIRRRGLVTAFSLNTVLRCCGEIDDRVDPIWCNAQRQCQIDIALAEGINEGIDFSAGCCANSICNAIPVTDRDTVRTREHELAHSSERLVAEISVWCVCCRLAIRSWL